MTKKLTVPAGTFDAATALLFDGEGIQTVNTPGDYDVYQAILRQTVTVGAPIVDSDLSPADWNATEAIADADTRKSFVTADADLPGGDYFFVYRGPDPVGDLGSLGRMILNGTTGLHEWTSGGQSARNTEVFHRIARGQWSGSAAVDPYWVVDEADVKSFRASTVPQPPVASWVEAGPGAVTITVEPDENTQRRGVTALQYSLNDGSTWTTNGNLTTIALTGLTGGVQTPVQLRWVNANVASGFPAGVLTLTVIAETVVVTSPPTVTGRHTLDVPSRTLMIIADSADGDPDPVLTLHTLTINGVDALSSATPEQGLGITAWRVVIPSSTTDSALVYVVRATNDIDFAAFGATVNLVADTAPPPVENIIEYVGFTAISDPNTSGRLVFDVSSVPEFATSLYARVITSGLSTDFLLTNSPAEGTFNLNVPTFAGRRVYISMFARNGLGDGPVTSGTNRPEFWIHAPASVVCSIYPSVIRSGDTAILTIEQRGWPEASLDSFVLTQEGTPVVLDGDGSVRTFVVPPSSAGDVLTFSASMSNNFGSASHSVSKTVAADIVWKTPTNIADRAALDAAIASATGGEVLRCASGDYGDLVWSKNLTVPVKITSQVSKAAVFGLISLSGTSRKGLWVEDLTYQSVRVESGASGFTSNNCEGATASARSASDIVLVNNVFDAINLDNCFTFTAVTGSYIADNQMRDSVYDLCRIIDECFGVVFERNYLSKVEVYPNGVRTSVSTKHPDLLQLYKSDSSSSRPPRCIAIRRNHLFGIDGRAQGLFSTDSRSVEGYRNIVIADNHVRCSYTRKVTLEHMSLGSVVIRNTATGYLTISNAYAGLATLNLATKLDRNAVPASLLASLVVDNFLRDPSPLTGDLSVAANFIPPADAGIPDRYGATAYLKSLEAPEPVTQPLSSIDATGWFGTMISPPGSGVDLDPVGDPEVLTVQRQGFGPTLIPETKERQIRLLTRKRELYGAGSRYDAPIYTANQAALESFLYHYDSVPDVTGTLTGESLPIIANWVHLKRQAVTDTITLQVLAFHAHAETEPLAGCRFIVQSGTITRTVDVSATTLYNVPSTAVASDKKHPFGLYEATISVADMADGLLTINCELFPHFGVDADVLRSASAGKAITKLSPCYAQKVPAGSKRYVAVHTTAGTSGGIVATRSGYASDEAAALAAIATPFQTWAQAMTALHVAPYYGSNAEVIICNSGVTNFSPSAGRAQPCAHLIVTSAHTYDPVNYSRAGAQVSTGGSPNLPSLGLVSGQGWMIVFRKIDVLRVSTFGSSASSGGYIECDDCNVDFNNLGSMNGSNIRSGFRGCRITNCESTSIESSYAFFGNHVTGSVGSYFRFPGNLSAGNESENSGIVPSASDAILTCNVIRRGGTSSLAMFNNTSNSAIIQNIVEMASGGWDASRMSGDSATESVFNVIMRHNVIIAWASSRMNSLYDETSGVPRFHRGWFMQGNICIPMLASKLDIFTSNDARQGAPAGIAFDHGVDAHGNMHLRASNFPRYRPGLNGLNPNGDQSIDNTRFWSDAYNPRFVNIGVAHTNAGGSSVPQSVGDYHITDDLSSAKNRVRTTNGPLVKFDLAGNLRAGNTTDAGAYIIG